jgi:hypothetical protein
MYLSCPESMESMDPRRTASGKHTIETIEKWRIVDFAMKKMLDFP